MDPREVIKNNGYIGPASFAVGTPYMNLAPTNWGVPAGPLLLVSLDPQVDVGKTLFQTSSDSVDFVKRRIRRKVMSELANEFATSNDDLLRELARQKGAATSDFLADLRSAVVEFHDGTITKHGGLPGFRDEGLFDFSVARPWMTVAGEAAYKTAFEKAAAIAEAIVRNHVFNDGNHRTALAAAHLVLGLHNMQLVAPLTSNATISVPSEVEAWK